MGTSGATAGTISSTIVFNTATSGYQCGRRRPVRESLQCGGSRHGAVRQQRHHSGGDPRPTGFDRRRRPTSATKVQSCFGSNRCAAAPQAPMSTKSPVRCSGTPQGLNFGGSTLLFDLSGATLPVTWNTANMTTNGSLGALLLHHHNTTGKRAQVVTLQGATTADLAIAQTLAPAAPAPGQSVTITLTATNNGPAAATGVTATVSLPVGLTYLRHQWRTEYQHRHMDPWQPRQRCQRQHQHRGHSQWRRLYDHQQRHLGRRDGPGRGQQHGHAHHQCGCANRHRADQRAQHGEPDPCWWLRDVHADLAQHRRGYAVQCVSCGGAFVRRPSSAASTASSGSFNNGTGVWTIASVASGATVTATVTVTAPSMVGALTLTANASAENAPSTQQAASSQRDLAGDPSARPKPSAAVSLSAAMSPTP